MKKAKMSVAFIIFSVVIAISSCSENPTDKKLDELEAILIKAHTLARKDNPSQEDIVNLKTEFKTFQESVLLSGIQDDKLTESQKKRMLMLMAKFQNISNDPGYQRLQNFGRPYHLNP